jgi:GNAT superfamily N-acetyltransferase
MVILKFYDEVEPFLKEVQACADAHKKEFGFLPKGAYQDQALQGKLWVAIDDKGALNGYLIFGGAKPSLKVFQMFIHPDDRGKGIASHLIKELEAYGEKHCFLSIKARVAADLTANHFWEKNDFFLAEQVPGGKTTNRIINVRVKDLETPSFLEGFGLRNNQRLKQFHSIDLGNHPILSRSVYALDLNVFFDLLKKRRHEEAASSVFNAGWNNVVKLCVTPEFISELERTSEGLATDPLLLFAKDLPQLSRIKEADLDRLCLELQKVVFPQRSKGRKAAKNDKSDLRHLCYAISHSLSGFVTREKAILNARERLLEAYGLDVVAPSDFSRSDTVYGGDDTYSIAVNEEAGQLEVCTSSSIPPATVDAFLNRMQIGMITSRDVWSEGVVKNRQRHLSAHYNGELVAIGSWIPPLSVTTTFDAFLFVLEECGDAVRVIDHFLEKLLRDVPPGGVHRISLIIGKSQSETLSTAGKRGFVVSQEARSASVIKLVKYAVGGVIDQKRWGEFVHKMKSLEPNLTFPEELPSIEVFCNTGVLLRKDTHPVKLFEFENVFSPGIALPQGRDAIIVPIKQAYADQLVGRVNNQLQWDFVPGKPALICMERAYFRAPRGASKFKQGLIVVFYVSASRDGGKELLGWARITSSQLMHIDDVKIRLSRQGVLSDDELSRCADDNGMLHAFTFDNFSRFPGKIRYDQLKYRGFIDGANLVTAQHLPSKKLAALCDLVY